MRRGFISTVLVFCTAWSPWALGESADEAVIRAVVAANLVSFARDAEAFKANSYGYDPELVDATWEMIGALREIDSVAAQQFVGSSRPHPKAPADVESLEKAGERAVQGAAVRITGDRAAMQVNGRQVVLKRVNGQWMTDASQAFPKLPAAKAKVVLSGMRILAAKMREMARELPSGTYADWPAASRVLDARVLEALRNDPEVSGGWRAAFGNTPIGPEQLAKWGSATPVAANPMPGVNTPTPVPRDPKPVQSQPPGPAVAAGVPATQPIPHEDDHADLDAIRTELVGGKGGGEFIKTGSGGAAVVALRYSMGRWSNRPVIREIEPVFAGVEANQPPPGKETKWVAARKGYVLGGLVVDTDLTNATAFKAVFVRLKDGRPDPADQYTTDWCGTPAGLQHQQKLAGKGEKVVGICGRKGLNVDALGLVIEGRLHKTARAGGDGGSPFSAVGPNDAAIVGFRYSFGDWGRPVLRQLDPIFDGVANDAPPQTGEQVARAKEGYAVGGVLVDTDDTNTVAVKITFFRRKGDRLDAADAYTSDWIGTPSGIRQLPLAGHGETVVGVFGRKGLNLDGFGLLVLGDDPVKTPPAK